MKISKQKRSSYSKKSKNRLNMIKVKQSIKQIEKSLQKNFKNSKKSQPIIITNLQKNQHHHLFIHKEEKGLIDCLFNESQKLKTDQGLQSTILKYHTIKAQNKNKLHSNSKTKQKLRICSPKHLFSQKTLVKRTISKKSTQNSSQHTLIEQLKEQNQYYQQKYMESMEKLSKLSKELNEERKVHEAQKIIYERKIYQLKYQIFLKQSNIDTPPLNQQDKSQILNKFQEEFVQINQDDQYYQLKLLSNISEKEQ